MAVDHVGINKKHQESPQIDRVQPKKRPSLKGSPSAHLIDDFRKKSKNREEKMRKEQILAIEEQKNCTFTPKIKNYRAASLRRKNSSGDVVNDLYKWKKNLDEKKTANRIKSTLNDKNAKFQPQISKKSKELSV